MLMQGKGMMMTKLLRALTALALLAVLLAPLASAASAQDGETRKSFKDWLGACRADGYCSATTYENPGAAGTVADYILRVGRHAEQSYWEISLTTVATQADDYSDFVIDVDGQAQSFSLHEQVGAYGSINDFFFLGEGAQTVMDRLVSGETISISFNDTSATAQQARFSLSGLSAVLLWIDEQQKRVGSERVASVPPYGLVPTSQSQQSTPAIPTALLDRHRGDLDCEQFEDLPNGRGIAAEALDEEHRIYILPCQAGAYNFTSKIYVEAFGEFEPQYFADYSGDLGWTGTSQLVNVEYDADTKQLSTFAKGRGMGDCGTIGSWVWQGYGFKLLEFRSRDNCDWNGEGEVPEFPLIYPPQAVTKD
jgi:hypothetical protein